MNPNRRIYSESYTTHHVNFTSRVPYDKKIYDFRRNLVGRYGSNSVALDLCCGSGEYSLSLLSASKLVVGLDFSKNFLIAFFKKVELSPFSHKVILIEGDATCLPLQSNSFDLVYSFCSLYYIPNSATVIYEVARVLRSGGIAILELGNANSLATITSWACFKYFGWAKPYHISYSEMKRVIKEAGLHIEEHYAFQILPMFGPKLLQIVFPFSLSVFKYVMGITIAGKLLDSWISGMPIIKRLAFRHIFIVSKK